MHHQGDDEQRRDAVRTLDELITGTWPFADVFEAPDGVGGEQSGATDASGHGSRVLRGGDERRSATSVEVRFAHFAEPSAGEGSVATVRLSLIKGPGAPGQERVRCAVHDVGSGAPVDLGWEGRASGRLLLLDGSLDFHARDGSCVTRRDGGAVLELALGPAWRERDETPGELLAVLQSVLVLRED